MPGGKLVAHLCGHERVGDVVLLEVLVQGNQVEADLLGHDVNGGAAGEGGIHVHHAGIKAIAGIGGHPVLGLEVIVALIPVAEGHQVGMRQLAALGNARGAGGVEQDEQLVRLDGDMWGRGCSGRWSSRL